MNIFNTSLRSDLMETVERIPKDLRFWRRETERLSKIKRPTAEEKEQLLEYRHLSSYYQGKLIAYLFVLDKLGDTGFVRKYEKKHKFTARKWGNGIQIRIGKL